MADEEIVGIVRVEGDASGVDKAFKESADKAEKNAERMEKAAKKAASARTAADRRIIEEEKRLTETVRAESKERIKAAEVELQATRNLGKEKDKEIVKERGRQQRLTETRRFKQAIGLEQARGQTALDRGTAQLAVQESKILTKVVEGEQRRATLLAAEESKKRVDLNRDELVTRRRDRQREITLLDADARKIDSIIGRSLSAPAAIQAAVSNALTGRDSLALRQNMMSVGATRNQAISAQLGAAGLSQQQIAFLLAGGRRPPGFGPPPGGRGGGGFFGGIGRRLAGLGGGGIAGSLIGGALGGFGIGLGGYALAGAAQGVVASTEQATAYERQRVAAENLAGSQEKLNQLLAAYTEASGGAIDKVTTLSNVTRLLATGFAESAPEVEKFVRATRGASIALGRPQDYVIQETQLAISNISVKRLDQIGLGIEEVNNRIEEMRKNNVGWTREMAFQDAVVSLLSEKYGHLADSAEGQATEIEKLGKAWRDLGLAVGDTSRGPLNTGARWLTAVVNALNPANEVGESESGQRAFRRDRRFAIEGFTGVSLFDLWGMITGRSGVQIRAQHALDSGMFSGGARGDSGYSDYVPPPLTGARFRRMREGAPEIIEESYAREEEIIRESHERRNQAIAQYEEQRTQVAANFAKQMVREEEDFARARVRAERDYQKSIQDIHENAAEREADMQEDLDESLAEMREDSTERLGEIEEKFREDRERAERQHRERLMKAAGQLNAIAILEERQRWKEENEERQKGHREAVEKEKEALEERIQEALEAHQERLEDAREADQERLQDMEEARRQQIADENEDRQIRKNRAIEDHNAQLAEMDRQHDLTLQRIEDEATAEREALQDALEKDLAAVGEYIAGYHEKMQERDKLIDEWFDKIIARIEHDIREEERERRATGVPFVDRPYYTPGIPAYQSGGYVGRTGPAILHAGEYVLSQGMLASGYSPVSNSSVSDNSRSLVIQDGAFRVSTTPGMETLVGESIREVIIGLLEEV